MILQTFFGHYLSGLHCSVCIAGRKVSTSKDLHCLVLFCIPYHYVNHKSSPHQNQLEKIIYADAVIGRPQSIPWHSPGNENWHISVPYTPYPQRWKLAHLCIGFLRREEIIALIWILQYLPVQEYKWGLKGGLLPVLNLGGITSRGNDNISTGSLFHCSNPHDDRSASVQEIGRNDCVSKWSCSMILLKVVRTVIFVYLVPYSCVFLLLMRFPISFT